MTTSARRTTIKGIEAIGFAAADAARRIRSAEPGRLPVELAQAVDALLAAADDVARLAEREIVALEGARDWSST